MPFQPRRLLPAATLLLVAVPILAAPPQLRDVTPRGVTIGERVTLRLVGANLQGEPRLISQLPISDAKVESSTANECRISFATPADANAGIYALRLATSEGISEPILIGADQLPQQMITANDEVALPVALTGALTGSTIREIPFGGNKGQRVVVDIEAQRLAGKLNPVLRLIDERGTQIAWSGGESHILGDARLETVLPADGKYRVRVHDKLYRGAAPGHFRLKIGELHFADYVLPLGIQMGETAKLEILGDESGEPSTREMTIPQSAPPTKQRPVELGPSITGGRPVIFVSSHPELIEPAGDEEPLLLPRAPVAVSGRLSKPGETDRFQLPVTAGEKLRIELHSARLGAPVDGVIDVLRDNGQRFGGNDDQQGSSDPRVDFTVPGGVERITIAVRDMLGRGGKNCVYRLSVLPLDQPDFSLTVEKAQWQLPANSVSLLRVTAQRSGYLGPIQLITHGLLESDGSVATTIPAGSNVGLLTLFADQTAGGGTCVIEGRSVGDGPPVRRVATVPASDVTTALPHLQSELGWAVVPTGPLQLAWQFPSETVQLGDRLAVPVSITRAENAKGEVRLSLLTNQIVPKKKVKNEKTKKDEMVDDIERTFRLEGTPVIAAGASETTVHILTPPGAADRPWDFVLRGELLSADKKNVLATTYTEVQSVASRNPLRLEVVASETIEAKAGPGETGVVRGSVHREEGFSHPVTLSLIGLPEGYSAETVSVAGDKTDFEFPIRFQAGAKPSELKNIRVVATAQLDPKNPARTVRSNAVPVKIKVVPGEKPPQ